MTHGLKTMQGGIIMNIIFRMGMAVMDNILYDCVKGFVVKL